jgi:hypothetical protein
MSKFVRKQMLSVVEQLKIAAKYAGADTPELLADCQEAAITLGTRLEKIRGTGTRTVAELEAYCEELYQAGEAFGEGNGQEIRAKLLARVRSVERCLKEDMPDRTEVVFLPYNASMWDSLESVWMAARDDESCEDYVIPIPYYHKKEDGTLGDFFYEGDQFPDYVPITNYKDYDLSAHHPDIIYIHNPYDEINIITSIEPRYFSRRIRFFTAKLVYIPYFVLQEVDPEDGAAVEGISHFCFLPGTLYADQVILQSENMRKVYLKVFKRGLKGVHLQYDPEALEKKFLGTGSPKFDRVGRVNVTFDELPEGWRRVMVKPDGTHKKVIFYNTSVGAMIQSGAAMIKKIKDVLRQFEQWKDEVTLLWRPHPLTQANLEAMFPQLWDEYRQIVEHYKEGGWGIYDDSPDLDRAIAVSDAYYGDQSSVVQLCRKAGMPVMIQNADVLESA